MTTPDTVVGAGGAKLCTEKWLSLWIWLGILSVWLVASLAMCKFCVFQDDEEDNHNSNDGGSGNEELGGAVATIDATTIGEEGAVVIDDDDIGKSITTANLSLQDRIELYNQAFDSNGNQLTLEEKHIVADIESGINNNTLSHTCSLLMVVKENPIIAVTARKTDATAAAAGAAVSGNSCNWRKDDNSESSFTDTEIGINNVMDRSFPLDNNNLEEDNNCCADTGYRSRHPIHIVATAGKTTCVICFEDFVPGNQIVWSENSFCRHAFHKECMVRYLANNSHRRQSSSLSASSSGTVEDNPCPTCRRRNYCTIQRDNLAMVISLESENNDSSSSNNISGGDNAN